ncbi:TPA: hypothetical protein HA231_05195 [Candidatus Woesearchaeota archaeon]|nr:hypothetical protein [Candidatus Woesearchaeota archaeon]
MAVVKSGFVLVSRDDEGAFSVSTKLTAAGLDSRAGAPGTDVVLAAFIKQEREKTEFALQKVLSQHPSWKVGGLEIAVVSSQLNFHLPERGSPDSDALYVARNDEFGILLQYLDPAVRFSGDAVSHTSVHGHYNTIETYYALYGWPLVLVKNQATGKEVLTRLGTGRANHRLTVPLGNIHPVIALGGPTLTLIVTSPSNNTKNDHHYAGMFREVFPDVASKGLNLYSPSPDA